MATNNAINCSTAGQVRYDGAGTFTADTLTQYSLLLGGATNAIGNLGVLTNGQLAIGSTGADPVAATLTAGTGIGITNAAGSITVAATGGGITWTEVTGTSQAADVNNGYIGNNAGLVTVTLPDTAALGSVVRVVGKGAGKWKIAQNAGETIYFGSSTTTTGATGYLQATAVYDCIYLLCTVANTDWTVMSSMGNITVA